MKVLHLLDNTFGPDPRVQKEINTLINELKIEVILVCIYNEKPEILKEGKFEIMRILPFGVHYYYKMNLKIVIDSILKVVEDNEISLIHAHDHISLHLASFLKKKKPEIKIIYDAHEYIRGWFYFKNEINFIKRLKGLIVHKIYTFHEKRNLKQVDELITVSIGISNLYRQKLNFTKAINVIRNVNYLPSHTVKQNVREKFQFSAQDVILIHSGGIYYSQEIIDYFLKNISVCQSNIKVVFLSKGNERKKITSSKYYKLIERNVFFHDFVKYEDLTGFISTADVGIMLNYKPKWPSHWFSLPNRIFDYSNAGLAILSTNQPEFSRFIKENKNGEFFNLDIKLDLSEKLKTILHDRQE